eukprot:6192200-Pleurochrysis_carterae.AAC.1
MLLASTSVAAIEKLPPPPEMTAAPLDMCALLMNCETCSLGKGLIITAKQILAVRAIIQGLVWNRSHLVESVAQHKARHIESANLQHVKMPTQ